MITMDKFRTRAEQILTNAGGNPAVAGELAAWAAGARDRRHGRDDRSTGYYVTGVVNPDHTGAVKNLVMDLAAATLRHITGGGVIHVTFGAAAQSFYDHSR